MKFANASLFLVLSASAFAAPYAWLPGSSGDSEPSGNRMVIVDLADGSLVTAADGVVLADLSTGSDPSAPAFSPNGRTAYVLSGGTASNTTGVLLLFDVQAVLDAVATGGTPTPFQKISFPSAGTAPVAFAGATVSPDGTRVYVVESGEATLHVFDVDPESRELLETSSLPTGANPLSIWLTADGSKGYVANFTEGTVRSFLLGATPAEGTVLSVPLPAQEDTLTIPATTARFTVPHGTSAAALPPPNVAPVNDSRLHVFSGHFGLKVAIIPGIYTTINDPCSAYDIDTTTDTVVGGAPLFTINPTANQVIFPPFVHSYDIPGEGAYGHFGGSTMVKPTGTRTTLTITDADLVMMFGQLPATPNQFLVGSVAVPSASAFQNGTYAPVRTTSKLYSWDTTATGGALVTERTVQRYLSVVVGFAGDNTVAVGSDSLSIGVNAGISIAVASPRNTQVILYNQATNVGSTLDLGLVAGAYSQAPPFSGPEPYSPADSDGDGYTNQIESHFASNPNDPASRPAGFADYNGNGTVDLQDALLFYRNVPAALRGSTENLDIDGNGVVNKNDALDLFHWVLGNKARTPVIPTGG